MHCVTFIVSFFFSLPSVHGQTGLCIFKSMTLTAFIVPSGGISSWPPSKLSVILHKQHKTEVQSN